MGCSTNECWVLGLWRNIRGHSTRGRPHPYLQECHKALKGTSPCRSHFRLFPLTLVSWLNGSYLLSVFVAALVLSLHNKILLDGWSVRCFLSWSFKRGAHVIIAMQPARWMSAETHMEQIKAVILWSFAVDTSDTCWYHVCAKGMMIHFHLPRYVHRPIACKLWFAGLIPHQLYSYIICYDQMSETLGTQKQVRSLRWKFCWVIGFILIKPISQTDIFQDCHCSISLSFSV